MQSSLAIDGSRGEGGGQIVRTSLALAAITGRRLRMVNVRAGRAKPGLARQHLTAIRATQEICAAEVTGASVGSRAFTFDPGPVRPGEYSFDVGSAGSTTLVLQTIALPLALAAESSRVTIVGGTHNPMAPCYDYLDAVWAPLCRMLHVGVALAIERAGFYPAGGGRIRAEITGVGSASALLAREIAERSGPPSIEGVSAVARLPLSIAERQARQAEQRLDDAGLAHGPIELRTIDAISPGTLLFLACRSDTCPAAFFGLGARGKRAERVADEAADQLIDYAGRPGALDPHAADQLVLPLALAPGRSAFTTSCVSSHLTTHIDLLREFLGRSIELAGAHGDPGRVEIG